MYREVDGRELYEIEDVAIRLALPPFDYHYGAGDDRFDAGGGIDRGVQDRDGQSVGGDGQNEDDLTNLEWWVRGRMFITLETRCEVYMTAITPCVKTSLPSDPFAWCGSTHEYSSHPHPFISRFPLPVFSELQASIP